MSMGYAPVVSIILGISDFTNAKSPWFTNNVAAPVPPAAKISGNASPLQSITATPPPTKWFQSPE